MSRGKQKNAKQQKVKEIYAAVQEKDFEALEDLAFSSDGFVSSELRRSVWCCLLGLSQQEALDASWRKLLAEPDPEYSRVMEVDVERSVFSWDVHQDMIKALRSQRRKDLGEVMRAVMQRHPDKFTYFQGFHDIVLVFLEVVT